MSLCLSNAAIYERHNCCEKSRTLKLVAEVIRAPELGDGEEEKKEACAPPPGEGAIGKRLIRRIFDGHTDTQFLTILYTILRDTPYLPGREVPQARYEIWIRSYRDMLYRWGELNEFVEVGKHMKYGDDFAKIQVGKADAVSSNGNIYNSGLRKDHLDFGFKCSKCGTATSEGGNFCEVCQDFAFKCAVCCCRVNGAFISCFNCGHGGCLDHYTEWFSTESQCPAGCGCECLKNCFADNVSSRNEHSNDEYWEAEHQKSIVFLNGMAAVDSFMSVSSDASLKSRDQMIRQTFS